MQLTITTNARELSGVWLKFPDKLKAYLNPAIQRGAIEIARSAKAEAPQAFGTLANAITQSFFPNDLEAIVKANTNYAFFVEKGTKGGGMPSNEAILDWIKVKNIDPRNGNTQRDLAFLIRRKIFKEGTPAQPFMEPAFENNKQQVSDRIQQAINKAIRELNT